MFALVAPGQGAQTPGMLVPWLDLPGASARVRWLGSLTGLDLERLGTTADADEIRDTAVAQPLIVALGLIAAAELALEDVAVTAGHSVGELTAACVAGVLTPEAAAALAAVRGRAMAAACAEADTGMSAVLGGDPDEVLTRIETLGLSAANRNGGGQVVAAGAADALRSLAADPPAGARIRPLQVAGAFHTRYMASAGAALEAIADGITATQPERLLLSNSDGTAVATGRDAVRRLVRQLTAPVRWDRCQAALRDLGVTALVELPPAGALTNLAKRELPEIERLALKTPDDLPAARALIARSAPSGQAVHTPDWRVVVAPIRGSFHPARLGEGAALPAGARLGEIRSRRDEQHVSAGYDAVLVEWLAFEGDLVDAGDPLARLVVGTDVDSDARLEGVR